MSNDGNIWFDSGVNTLVHPFNAQDESWEKIRCTKTRFELFDRLDRALQPKVGRINCDTDGIGDVIQIATRVLDTMINERKLSSGAAFARQNHARIKYNRRYYTLAPERSRLRLDNEQKKSAPLVSPERAYWYILRRHPVRAALQVPELRRERSVPARRYNQENCTDTIPRALKKIVYVS